MRAEFGGVVQGRVAAVDGVPVLLGVGDVQRCHLRPPFSPVFPLIG